MRLIDADEIIKETWSVEIKDMFHMNETVDVISKKDIEKAPTVNAIPIEWVKKWVRSNCMYCYDYDYPTEPTDGYYEIMHMIEDWERRK